MNKAGLGIDAARLRAIVLARLWPVSKRAPSRKVVVTSVADCLGAASQSQVLAAAERALDSCIAEELLRDRPLGLTTKGRDALRSVLRVQTLPEPKSWAHVRRWLLVELSLGRIGSSGRPMGPDQLAAAILARHSKIPNPKLSLRVVVDRMAWRALGVETDAPFDVGPVQRHLLRDLVSEDSRVDFPTWRRLLAVRVVGARRGDADSLREALLSEWARGSDGVADGAVVPVAQTANDNQREASLAELAQTVRRAASDPGVVRFHDDRAFIGSIWDHLRGRPPVGSMSLAQFKAQLVAAHNQGLLRMSRADLVAAMDPRELERSEANHMGSVFHFVALEAGANR